MKRKDLIKRLTNSGCILVRHGSATNPITHKHRRSSSVFHVEESGLTDEKDRDGGGDFPK